MPERRTLDDDNPDLREDRGIFKTGVVTVSLDVTPLRRKTSRGDILCVGFMNDVEIDVIFPGRRTSACKPLLVYLDKMVNAARQLARRQKRLSPQPLDIRYTITAEGTWRVRTVETDNIPERRYQFLAARWTIQDRNGERVFGDLPAA